MVYGCGNSLVKCLFFFVNLLICLLGALIFGFSLWANLDKNFATTLGDFVKKIAGSDKELVDKLAAYEASLWILVAVGALLFFVGFLGCCGAACESPVLLGLFFFIILILTAIELGATVYAMTNREKFVDAVQEALKQSSKTYDMRRQIKPIQDLFKCCGATKDTQAQYINDGLCDTLQSAPDCFSTIERLIDSSGEAVVVIGFALLGVELLSLLFSCMLCRASREVRYDGYYS